MVSRESVRRRLKRTPGAIIDVHAHVGVSVAAYLSQAYPYCLSLEDLIIRTRALGIDATVVFPHGSAYYATRAMIQGRPRPARDGLCRFPYEVENRHLLHEVYEVFPAEASRFLPFCMFDPSRRVPEQARHIAALARDYPVYGLKTVTSYNQSFVTDLLRKPGRSILDVAADLDLPVLIHCAVVPGDVWANVFDVLGVVQARPDVRFCVAHTARFNRPALEAAAGLPNCFVDLSAFHIHCALACKDSPAVAPRPDRFPADYRRPVEAMKKIADAFPETILWGTDTPFYYWIGIFTDARGRRLTEQLRCAWDTEARALRRLPAATVRRIAHDNTLRFLFG